MRARPIESAIVLAAIAHVAAVGVLLLVRPSERLTSAIVAPDAVEWDVDPTPVIARSDALSEPRTQDESSVDSSARGGSAPHADKVVGRRAAKVGDGAFPIATPVTSGETDAVGAPSEPWSFSTTVPKSAKYDDYWKSIAMRPAPSATASVERPSGAQKLNRILRDELDANDRAIGLGSSGTLVSAAHAAASPSLAPDVGSATLEIECDATGHIVAARVVATSADAAQWSAVAREIVRIASNRTVRVPAGARGVRTRLRIVAERALPSGSKSTVTPGATPDDVPGNMDEKACVGEGSTRKCLKGMPLGATGNLVDVVNIGARASRIVRVIVLGEQTL